mgnify:CR=1 FL=1
MHTHVHILVSFRDAWILWRYGSSFGSFGYIVRIHTHIHTSVLFSNALSPIKFDVPIYIWFKLDLKSNLMRKEKGNEWKTTPQTKKSTNISQKKLICMHVQCWVFEYMYNLSAYLSTPSWRLDTGVTRDEINDPV